MPQTGQRVDPYGSFDFLVELDGIVRASFAEALKDAQRYTGPNPKILALPNTFRVGGVHLMMASEKVPEA